MSPLLVVVISVAVGLAIGIPLAWWMYRPDPDAYDTAVRRHEAFGRYLDEVRKINQRMAQGGDAGERLRAKIRELESRREEGVNR